MRHLVPERVKGTDLAWVVNRQACVTVVDCALAPFSIDPHPRTVLQLGTELADFAVVSGEVGHVVTFLSWWCEGGVARQQGSPQERLTHLDWRNAVSPFVTVRPRRSNQDPNINRSPTALTTWRSITLRSTTGGEALSVVTDIAISLLEFCGSTRGWRDRNEAAHANEAVASTAPVGPVSAA